MELPFMTKIQRYLLVLIASFPFALCVRHVLGRVLQEDLPTATMAYVRSRKEKPLSEPLSQLLADARHPAPPSQPHSLLGRSAPEIALANDIGQTHRWDTRSDQESTLVIFYYGYKCVHCVAQLFALNEDIALFEELGVRVVAISDDPPEHIAAQLKKHGRFDFPLLSDPGNRVAQAYGVYQPPSDGRPELRQHGTFLIGRDGRVFWVDVGQEPFLDTRSLLIQLARHNGAEGTD
jgi:peroxiredoxin Q/BCP